ncbi:uncharacterized protein LTR77_005513 [Saxophila tyrrhenica]|uniref:Zn(2)-C6 fungal-type domain-containing protein n=1 Tax=Saxophila tyrrhenica TaxID=1690608 RepID=A0AAV9PBS7_9PEZI|nr:hypothetical protein LTR77_005513 [Saxophila tyrrhenica]
MSQQEQISAKYACTTCARRKVGCDRALPSCGNCVKHQAECRYEEPQPSQRHRKRKADVELIARITQLEELLRKNSIDPGAGVDINELTPQYKTEEKQLPILSSKPAAKAPPFPSEATELLSGYAKSKVLWA